MVENPLCIEMIWGGKDFLRFGFVPPMMGVLDMDGKIETSALSAERRQSVWLDRLGDFINPQEAAIFSGQDDTANYLFQQHLGPMVYFTYNDGLLKLEGSNARYQEDILGVVPLDEVGGEGEWQFSDAQEEKNFSALVAAANKDDGKADGEVWFRSFSQCCGIQTCCLRFQMRLVAKHGEETLYCALLQDSTQQKHAFQKVSDNESKFRAAADQANIYAWEYDIATHEMRPCSRCMRDLNLPPVVENYPEPMFESGLFPADYADMYRHWHKRIEQGESGMQAVIPLTKDRIPFYVRYTTEFDKAGKPVRAFGSATLAVDNGREVQLKEIIATLTTRYSTVLKIDLSTGEAEALNIGDDSSIAVQSYYYDDQVFAFEETLRNYIHDYVHPDDKIILRRVLDLKNIGNALTHSTAFSHTYRIIRKQKTRYMQLRLFAMADKNKVILTIQNVDEIRNLQGQAEDKLKLDLQETKSEADIRQALVNNMADNEKDVIRIMQRIIGENDQLDPEFIKRFQINATLLEELATDIFEASALEKEDEEPGRKTFDLRNMFKTVDNFAKVIAEMKGIELFVDDDLSELKETEVHGNMVYVKRILFNVVHNALKYSDSGSEIHCSIEAKEHGGRITCKCKVSDEGIGIAPEFQPHMFDPFSQENRQIDSWANGQGLGLYVAKQLLERMGGSIAVYSAVGIGTIVTVNMSFDIV